MDMIKRFVTCYIPVHACNFRCQYCYLSHHIEDNVYGGGINSFADTPSNIVAFFSKERMGGACYFNLCAPGETMLHPQINELVYELTKEGHYTDIVTNGTMSAKFDELVNLLSIDQRKHLFIKFSFHYLELIKRGKLDDFLRSVDIIRNSGISFSIEVTPHDELIPYIDEIKSFSLLHFGALPHITVARNEGTEDIALLSKYGREKYRSIWSTFNSKLFDFKLSIFNEKRNEFCYAGLWSLAVDLENGIYRQCYCGDELGNFTNKNEKIKLRPIGKCRLPHCFNGHAFLAVGDIPELNTPTYIEERDRLTSNGEHWFCDELREFYSTKLYENNKEYSKLDKKRQIIVNTCIRCVNKGAGGCNRIIGMMKKNANNK